MTVIETDARRLHDLLRAGGLALACTDTGYGLVAMGGDAVRRIYELKGRPMTKPCVTVGSMPILDEVTQGISPRTRAWIARATVRWPLAVIAHLNPRSRLLAQRDPVVAEQSQHAGTIALFFGVGPLLQRVAELAFAEGEVVVGSSANVSGTGNNYRLEEVPPEILGAVDLVIEGTPRFSSRRRLASTILDLTREQFQRRGVEFDAIAASWQAEVAGDTPASPP